ncbi:hypothetical protein PHBOTO_000370 [Pseudozyma hubeiensis]|nr:hypothetical protein PHBOTO_000370 [Pseudozyma hubeiensis]
MIARISVPPVASRLTIRDSNPDHTFQGHDSQAIADALTAHSQKMSEIQAQSSTSPTTYQGHDSSDIAKAIQGYVITHQDSPWLHKFTQPTELATSSRQPSMEMQHSTLAVTTASSSSISSGNATLTPVFSLSQLIQQQYWMSVVLCIVWIVLGLLLLFFGWASFFWGCQLGNSAKRIDERVKKAGRLSPLFAGPPLAAGVGGFVLGFLFFSFLATVITTAICVADQDSISSTSLFFIWLLPGLLGAFLSAHWPLFARAFTGLLSGACFTLIVTAVFGIHTLIIRTVVIIVFTSLVTAPLLIPRRNAIHFHLLNICTSIIGMVTFLDGVALFAPPRASSDSWIDLWVVLFAPDNSASELSATKKWGTGAFKGLIAASVLGTLVGFAFEFVFHKHAAEDPDMEWNNYLGSFTQRLGDSPDDRAGSFEPEASTWQKLTNAFTPATKPAYGNVSAAAIDDLEKSPLTDLPRSKLEAKARRARNGKKGPAKFSVLNRTESDSETDYDSDSSSRKLNPGAISTKSLISKAVAYELADHLKPLASSGDSKYTKASSPGLLARPPSYRTNTGVSANGSTGSGISGTTVNPADPTAPSRLSSISGGPAASIVSSTRPGFERGTTMSPPPPFPSSTATSPLAPSFPATPSLINAITRIQAAQAQARAWYESNQQQTSSAKASAEVKTEVPENKSATRPNSDKATEEQSTGAAASQAAGQASASFQSWWGKEVKGEPKP